MKTRRKYMIAVSISAFISLILLNGVARAELKLCSKNSSLVQVAVGYKNADGWASEGWWTVKPNDCVTLIKGPLIARYYYFFATDRGNTGGKWAGKSIMCVDNKAFTIKNFDKCEERGFIKAGFYEVDTGEQADWTVTLTPEQPK